MGIGDALGHLLPALYIQFGSARINLMGGDFFGIFKMWHIGHDFACLFALHDTNDPFLLALVA